MTTLLTLDILQQRIPDRLASLDIWYMGVDDPLDGGTPFAQIAGQLLHRPDRLAVLLDAFHQDVDREDIDAARTHLHDDSAEIEEGRRMLAAWLAARP